MDPPQRSRQKFAAKQAGNRDTDTKTTLRIFTLLPCYAARLIPGSLNRISFCTPHASMRASNSDISSFERSDGRAPQIHEAVAREVWNDPQLLLERVQKDQLVVVGLQRHAVPFHLSGYLSEHRPHARILIDGALREL